MKTLLWPALAVLTSGLVAGFGPARAQELFTVTGHSHPGVATLDTGTGPPRDLAVGRSVTAGTLHVVDGAQVMLFEGSGVAVVILGPATLVLTRDEIRHAIQLELRDGRVIVASARKEGEGAAVVLTARLAEPPRATVEVAVGPGYVFAARTGDQISVACAGETATAACGVRINDAAKPLAADQLLSVDATGQPQVGPLGDWLAQQGFEQAWGRTLGVASAREARTDVETNLFQNIIAWDRYAGAAYVSVRLREAPFNLEIRQNVETTTTLTRPSTRAAILLAQPFAGANSVPVVSPASASVQNISGIGQGVTAIQLNADAAVLLERTGSQGLGFRGLRYLAIPAFTTTGARTVGPAGLGGQP